MKSIKPITFFIMPLKSGGLGFIAGALSYIFLGVVTELSSGQRTIALLGWPLILFFLALFEEVKEYRRLNKRDHLMHTPSD